MISRRRTPRRMGIWRHAAYVLTLMLLVYTGQAYALNCVSTAGGGNWNVTGSWTPASCGGGVPGINDTVTVVNGATVTVTAAASAAAITVNNGGTLTIGNSVTGQTVTVTGNINVAGTFSVGAANATHTLNAAGDITNTGTINFRPSATRLCNVTFNKNGNQTVSGAGAYTFNLIIVNMGATQANILDMQSAMTVPSPFLTITNGTYKHSNASNITPWTADPVIPATGKFWLGPLSTAVVSTGAFNVSLNGGALQISGGAFNIGTALNNSLQLYDVATTTVLIDGGALNVGGSITSTTNAGAVNTAGRGSYTQTGGVVTVAMLSGGNLATIDTFLLGSGTTYTMSGGSLVFQNGDNATNDYNVWSTTQIVTGGTVQFGNAAEVGPNPFLVTTTNPGSSVNIWNMVVTGTAFANSVQIGATTNILNDVTIQANSTIVNNGAFAINVGGGNAGGNWTNNGTFTPNTGPVTMFGTSNANIAGTSATTFYNLTINKIAPATGVTLSGATNTTVSNVLTLTRGSVTTGANTLVTSANCNLPSVTRTIGFVVGNLQKQIPAAAFTCNFEVGSGTNYTPVAMIFATAPTGAGSVTASTTGTEHPSIGNITSGIDATKSVNRYWTLTNNSLTLAAAGYNATFTYINGSPVDYDAGSTVGNFVVERWNGTSWFPTTPSGACTTTSCTISGQTTFGDFAIGEALLGVTPVPGRYNAFETTTPAGAILGKIQTRIAGVPFGIDVVNINATKTGVQATAITVEIRLVDSSGGGVLDVNGCNAAWPVISVLPGASNPPNFAIPASGRGTPPAITVGNSYRDVRILIRSPVGGPYTQIGCSTDRFAIRPASLTVSAQDATWTTAGTARTLATGGGPVHKAGTSASPMPFTIKAVAQPASVTNYDGTPTIKAGSPVCNATLEALTPNSCTTGTLTLGAFAAAAGTVTSNTANYSEVGAFTLDLEDQTYANVDIVDGSTTAQRYITQTTAALAVGRFVPDHFAVAVNNTPQFKTFNAIDASCTGAAPLRSFTYVGQSFGWLTAPQVMITAQNAANGTTVNYSGALWQVVAGGVTETYPLAPFDSSSKGAPVVASILGGGGVGTGTGTATSNSGGTFLYTRGAPLAPYNANISLTVSVTDSSETATTTGTGSPNITTVTPVVFNGGGTGIAFDGGGASNGQEFRYGRLRISNNNGSELMPLQVQVDAQYWTGTGYATNAADNCTSLVPANFAQAAGPGAAITTTITGAGTVTAGTGTITLTKPSPTPAAKGSVLLTPAATISGYLPIAPGGGRETFGVFTSGRIIHLREIY